MLVRPFICHPNAPHKYEKRTKPRRSRLKSIKNRVQLKLSIVIAFWWQFLAQFRKKNPYISKSTRKKALQLLDKIVNLRIEVMCYFLAFVSDLDCKTRAMVPINIEITLRFKSVGSTLLRIPFFWCFFRIFLQILRSIFVKVRLFITTKKSRKKSWVKTSWLFLAKTIENWWSVQCE